MDRGTPKTLDEAIARFLTSTPNKNSNMSIQDTAYYILRDFLANKFALTYLTIPSESFAEIQKLFIEVTRRPEKKGDTTNDDAN